jgi:hypothetical protein
MTFEGLIADFRRELAADVAEALAKELPAPARLLTLEQAGDMLGLTGKSVRTMLARGQLVGVKVGPEEHASRVEVAEVDRYIAARRVASRSVT